VPPAFTVMSVAWSYEPSTTIFSELELGLTEPVTVTSSPKVCPSSAVFTVMVAPGGGTVVVWFVTWRIWRARPGSTATMFPSPTLSSVPAGTAGLKPSASSTWSCVPGGSPVGSPDIRVFPSEVFMTTRNTSPPWARR